MSELPIGPGDVGDAVDDLQHRLAALGFETTPDEPGCYGAATEAAVSAFQRRAGLDVDGRCDDSTWQALVEAGYQLGDRQLYLRSPMMRGDDIVELQRSLSALGFHTRRVDGIFGPETAASLAEFQRNCGLPSDGIFGPESMAALQRLGRARVDALDVASVRERELLRRADGDLSSRRIVVGEPGGVAALAFALTRLLREAGCRAVTVDHPDWSQHAREANALDAHLYVGLRFQLGAGVHAAYFAVPGFESAGGRFLAELVLDEVAPLLGERGQLAGMRLPVLRETRMPAVLVSLGSPNEVVPRTADLAAGLATAVRRWVAGAGPEGGDRSAEAGERPSTSAAP